MIDNIKAPSISLRSYSVTKPGDNPKLIWHTRNVKTVQFEAYKVDLMNVFKYIERINEIDRYSLKNHKPIKSWNFSIPDDSTHKYYSSNSTKKDYINVPISESGAYILTAYGENPDQKGFTVRIPIIISKLGLIVKAGKENTLVYTVNSLNGKPQQNVNILAQRLLSVNYSYIFRKYLYTYDYKDFNTDQEGIKDFQWGTQKSSYYYSRNLVILAQHGDDYAFSNSYMYYYWYGYNQQYRAYGFTDRPVYRPKQLVHFKQIIRKYEKGSYSNYANQNVRVAIYNPKWEKIYEQEHKTNQFGTLSGSFRLDEKPALGQYYINLSIGSYTLSYYYSSGNRFRVEEYKKPEYKVSISTKKNTYRIGDKITFKISSRYYFGSPVVNAKVEYKIYKQQYYHYYRPYRKYPWFYDRSFYYRWASKGFGYYHPYYYHRRELVSGGTLKSDNKGEVYVNVQTSHFKLVEYADTQYFVEANVVDQSRRNIRGYGNVKVTNKPFYIYLTPQRYIYEKDETAKIKITSRNPNNQPVSFQGNIKLYPVKYEQYEQDKRTYTREQLGAPVLNQNIFVNTRGELVFSFKANWEGYFKAIVTANNSKNMEIIGQCYIWFAKEKSEFDNYRYKDIEIIVDKDNYIIGDTAKILINTKHENSYVLLTAEADDIYYRKVIFIQGKSKLIELPITNKLTPNVYLTASTFNNNTLYSDYLEVIVPPEHKYLNIKVETPKNTFKPQETAEITVITKDYKGRGVSSELSLGFVDSSIFYIQSPYQEDIRKFFYGIKRYLTVRTSTGYDYSHYGQGKFSNRRAYKAKNGSPQSPKADKESREESDDTLSSSEKSIDRKQAKKMSEGGKRTGKESHQYKKARVRKDFPDTMYWNAHVKTDKYGVAKIKVKFPDTLTTWRINSTAVTKNTEVGIHNLDIVTRKNLIVRLQSPRFFQEKDLVYVSGIVHNYLDSDKRTKIHLKVSPQLGIQKLIYSGTSSSTYNPRTTKMSKEIIVPKNGEKRVDFVIKVLKKRDTVFNLKDMATVTISALTNEESDAMQMKFPVLEYGVEKFIAQNGILETNRNVTHASLNYYIPKDIKEYSQNIRVILNPSLASVMIDALPYLISYPYGCVEQTMSRFLPTVVTRNTLQKLGISLETIAMRKKNQFKYLQTNPIYSTNALNTMVDAGLDRLYSFQHADGGWGWWSNDNSNPYMTAYVIYGLYEASRNGVNIRKTALSSGVNFLSRRLSSGANVSKYYWLSDSKNVKIYILYVMSLVDPQTIKSNKKLFKILNDIWNERDELNEYSKILLSLTQHQIGDTNKAKIMLENIEDFIKVNKELNTANFQDINRYWYWYENGVESTSFALRAYLKINPESKYIPMMVKWLVRNRQGRRWFSTKDTAFVIFALAEYMKKTDELNPDLNVTVHFTGGLRKAFHVTQKNLIFDQPEFVIPANLVKTGNKAMKISIKGHGKIYYSTYLTYFTKEDRIKGAGHEIYVKRNYYKLTPKEITRQRTEYDSSKQKYVQVDFKDVIYDKSPLKFGERIQSGDLIEVLLSIKSNNNFEYLMFEDPKPAGTEPVELRSGYTYQGGFVANMELRDTKVSFFTTYITQGNHTISYKLRAEIPGIFNIMPTQSQAMYSPYVRGISDSWKMGIADSVIR